MSQGPGKVLSIKSLGFRETANKISLKEVNPYTVSVTRNLCNTEVLSVERQALTETKYGTQSFDCTDAYAEYIAHNITALGVPLLYDSLTGFNLLKEKCRKNPPVYLTTTTESNDIISEEAYDSNTTACKELPVADVLLTAKIDDSVIYIATGADGIASLPPEKVAQLERAASNADIKFHYEENELTTRHLRKKPEYPILFSTAAMNDSLADDVPQGDEAPSAKVSGDEIALDRSFLAALAPPQTVPMAPPTIFQGDRPSAPVARRAGSDQKVTAKIDAEGAGGKSSSPVFPSPAPVPEPPGDKSAAESKVAPAPEKIAAAETAPPAKIAPADTGEKSPPSALPPPPPVPVHVRDKSAAESKTTPVPEKIALVKTAPPAKVAPADTGEKSSLAALPSATTGPRHPREMILFYDPYAPAPESIAAAETPSIAKVDQGVAMKKGSQKIASAGAATPKAGKPLRDEIKNAVPAAPKQKSHVPAMARAKTQREELKAEIILQQLFILNPALYRICCPLTEKLFWKIGY